jgi:hypothetical protein
VLQENPLWVTVSEAWNNMHVKVRLALPCPAAVVLEDVHSLSVEGSDCCVRHFSHETVYALDLRAPDVQDGLAMIPRDDKHCPAFVLTLIDFGDCVLIFGNDRTLSCTRQVVAEAAGCVWRKLKSH